MEKFVEEGGTLLVVGSLPRETYIMGSKEKPKNVSMNLFPASLEDGVRHKSGRGFVQYFSDPGPALWTVLKSQKPDVSGQPESVLHVHRAEKERDIYFLLNSSSNVVTFNPVFRSARKKATLLDPLTGLAESHAVSGGAITLPPFGSRFVVFSDLPGGGGPVMKCTMTNSLVGSWTLTGQRLGTTAPPPTQELVLPRYWTDNAAWSTFSGQGTYRTVFGHPSDKGRLKKATIRLSEVRAVANVYVNGKLSGSAWCPPWQVDITDQLTAGTNELKIVVANTMLNRYLATPEPDLKALRTAYGNRFPEPEERKLMRPEAGGLAGPVYLEWAE
jgi:hypothetical protein